MKRSFQSVPYEYELDIEKAVIKMKKSIGIIIVFALLASAVLCISVANAASSVGPAPSSGDGIPSSNQYIQPETPGMGPAPNAGDGVSDGSGF